MANLQKQLARINEPTFKEQALLASSPYVMNKIFAADPTIRRLIESGEQVLPLIGQEIKRAKTSDEITLAAYAYIVGNVKPEAAPEILGPLYKKAVEDPGPFFVHFAAHAIRAGFRLPVKPLEIVYSRAELSETANLLH